VEKYPKQNHCIGHKWKGPVMFFAIAAPAYKSKIFLLLYKDHDIVGQKDCGG
jgi:hypothetical protein